MLEERVNALENRLRHLAGLGIIRDALAKELEEQLAVQKAAEEEAQKAAEEGRKEPEYAPPQKD